MRPAVGGIELGRPRWGNLLVLRPDHGMLVQLSFQIGAGPKAA